tara:strand:- start:48 stop:593 length:546 start_codon:yes stop_codon:yes gene_type:complete
MQGAIFTAFSEMIVDKMGMKQWNELIDKTSPASNGIYTSGAQYEYRELLNMVVALSEKTGVPAEKLVEEFGQYLFDILYKNSPFDVSKIDSLREFLLAIEDVIHVEVKRLNPDSYLPSFNYEDGPNGELIIYYSSKRQLCHASIGLIYGAAKKFDEAIEISHPQCMHDGAQSCKLIVKFVG